jgi:hypothetical protein
MQKSHQTGAAGGYNQKPDYQKRKAEGDIEEPTPIKKQTK